MRIRELYTVKSIRSQETHEWLLKKHYARRIPSISYSFGLYFSDMLVGVMTIGKPASPSLCDGVCGIENSKYVYELNRLCVNDGIEKNALSFFVSRCLSMIKGDLILVSYADTAMGHVGYIYQATNWLYTGITKERTDIGSEDGTHSRHYGKDVDKKSNRKFRSAKHRYVFFIGRNRKTLISSLNYLILPYPKGENKRYDTSYAPSVQSTLF
jgi:hypothetical protein